MRCIVVVHNTVQAMQRSQCTVGLLYIQKTASGPTTSDLTTTKQYNSIVPD